MIAAQISALAVASIFYCYREHLRRRSRRVRERVTYMLWVMADNVAA